MVTNVNGIKWVEVHYTDLVGRLKTISTSFSNDIVVSVDGSSIGVERIESSDVLVVGDRETLVKLPWSNEWGRIIGNIHKDKRNTHLLDSRSIAQRVEKYSLEEFGLRPIVGVELEFFLFRDINVDYNSPLSLRCIIKPIDRSIKGVITGYHTVNSDLDSYRSELAEVLSRHFNVSVKCHHHEVASSQIELAVEYNSPLRVADNIQTAKYVAKKLAEFKGVKACFTPKPIPGENGSGLHVHVSLWRGFENAFYDPSDKHGLSQIARYFIGGLLHHARALSAIVAPSVNSYRRLIPGYEAPVYTYWGFGNRSTCVRIPSTATTNSTRIEFRPPDPTTNPYLALSAIIMAGLDGIRKSIDPGDPLDTCAYNLVKVPREKRLPTSLLEALEELEIDNEFLKPVFPRELIEKYIEVKRVEYIEVSQHPSIIELLVYS
ncbi:MAG: glutamine synthetase beta-grasp domain-containing protein [Desulfurococcaceae archaeon]|nr:glutamine synthetase beta-grasp domain-containing protein [Desulfurococcaceae archaeon]